MTYLTQAFAKTLKDARVRKGLTQRTLSLKAGLPQSHISRIEAGKVDLQLSSLVALTRLLDLELMLVPRQAVPAVRSIVGDGGPSPPANVTRPAYRLDDDDGHA
ncbi:helix-turn-helix domain-containing protein [Reyranella sp. CPCC 100927]|uniref:helix-turn-helix domain-containing protein n=1 Tax=Reyranella sp. CPCC 100927 TaxID=2599616 RepID=UPI0011B4A768|nr:helix-turn-helix transcriptional regulator [Reyranella sp. CPCC 100927]TWT11472.1 helix-turn-helix transcriptional regulator [Reyranella sp. CPCC 100927]